MTRGSRTLYDSGRTFKLSKLISDERKQKIEKHPQAAKHFRFTRSGCEGKAWYWFISIARNNGFDSKTFTRPRTNYKRHQE